MTEITEIKNNKRSKSFLKTIINKILSYIPNKNYKKRKELAKTLLILMHKNNILAKIHYIPKHTNTIQFKTISTFANIKEINAYTTNYSVFLNALDLYGINVDIDKITSFYNKTFSTHIFTIEYSTYLENFIKLTLVSGEYPKQNQLMIDEYLKD